MFELKNIVLKNGANVRMRQLEQQDAEALYDYLNSLSAESRSRFGPHAFDKETVYNICANTGENIKRIIAINNDRIVAYMLLKTGMTIEDSQRYAQYNMLINESTTATYAPSVADDFQNTGLGSKMLAHILEIMKQQGFQKMILWGGVQATNAIAVHFYEKHGFKRIANFWHDNKDNIDMVLSM